jgi:hypothetical protein
MEKYQELVGVLAALGDMDNGQMARAWLSLTDTDWSPEGAAGGQALPAARISFENMFGSGRSDTPVLLHFSKAAEQQQQQQLG